MAKTSTAKAYEAIGKALVLIDSINWTDKELRSNEINIDWDNARSSLWSLYLTLESRL